MSVSRGIPDHAIEVGHPARVSDAVAPGRGDRSTGGDTCFRRKLSPQLETET